ncbi:glutathione synthetase ATP-binding domain-like protein [Hypoxylon sp. FL1150]|nr:glutathione synthetase ATP-binding domain-like protein [Hypoxylon sp. FL1150]
MASVGYLSVTHARISFRACITRPICSALLRGPPAGSRNMSYSNTSPSALRRVAVLYQALDPPVIGGVRKPKKPGGYQDSGADIAFNLGNCSDVKSITPSSAPDPAKDEGWCFPDTEDGALEKHQNTLQVIGQGPLVVEKYDDKQYVNDLLRRLGSFTMPKAWCIREGQDIAAELRDASYPVVAKPIRGRGSQGVKVCHSFDELSAHTQELFTNSSSIMIEEFLAGEEITITVMPPKDPGAKYWSLPVVTRFNHQQGIAPYNGVVAVTANSRAILESELDDIYIQAMQECEKVAEALGVTAPIRIDARRFKDSKNSKFALFDVNMKPNMTGPGRPGRDDQASLTLMAASALGWDYQQLLRQILSTSRPLKDLKALRPM